MLSPVFTEMRQTIQYQRELNLCSIHFRKKIKICRLQVVHSACIWKRHWSMLRVGRGKLTVQAPLHLFSPSYKLLIYHKICIQAFTWFQKKIWHPLEWQIPIFPPQSSDVAAWKFSSVSPICPQNQVISPQAGLFSSSTAHLGLRWHGYCSLCMSALRPTL